MVAETDLTPIDCAEESMDRSSGKGGNNRKEGELTNQMFEPESPNSRNSNCSPSLWGVQCFQQFAAYSTPMSALG